jgi:hypothetical protein
VPATRAAELFDLQLSDSVTAESGVHTDVRCGQLSNTLRGLYYVLRKSSGESEVCPSREPPAPAAVGHFSAWFPVHEMCGCQVLALRFSCYAPNQPRSPFACLEKKRFAKEKVKGFARRLLAFQCLDRQTLSELAVDAAQWRSASIGCGWSALVNTAPISYRHAPPVGLSAPVPAFACAPQGARHEQRWDTTLLNSALLPKLSLQKQRRLCFETVLSIRAWPILGHADPDAVHKISLGLHPASRNAPSLPK